jgi:hypothetical protein
MNCYYYKKINFNYGNLDNIIDAVYVLYLENSDRYNSILQQINNLKLSKNNYIQVNKGYKLCKKPIIQNSKYDLLHSNLTCFLHANSMNYNNILVLEDDFIFDKKILNKNIINELDYFINNYPFDIYSLGNLTGQIFSFNKHLPLKYIGCAHSVIVSKNVRNQYIYDYKYIDTQIDIYYTKFNNNYTFYYPLCYQTFNNTVNQKLWSNPFYNLSIKLLLLDKKPKYGFHILNILNIIFYTLFYFIFC